MGEAVDTIPSILNKPGRTDNVKTVYPPTNTVCGGINIVVSTCMI